MDITKELGNLGKLFGNDKSDNFKLSWIRLARTKNVGSKTSVRSFIIAIIDDIIDDIMAIRKLITNRYDTRNSNNINIL